MTHWSHIAYMDGLAQDFYSFSFTVFNFTRSDSVKRFLVPTMATSYC